MLHRPEMAQGYAALSEAIYGNTQLTLREREAARFVIAQLNDCAVCRGTRAEGATAPTEPYYAEIPNWQTSTEMSEREKLAAEFAQRFVLDHLQIHDEFFDRLRVAYSEDEIADLTLCCGAFLGLGRALAVAGVEAPAEQLTV